MLVLAACLPYFFSLIVGKHLQHLVQMDGGGGGGGCQQGETPTAQTATVNVATHHSQPVWKQIHQHLSVKNQLGWT